MADLTPERLAELRRIAEAATRCPECGVVWSLGRDVGGRVHTPGGIDCLHRQRDAARAEAERWRKKYEALRAGVERVADDLHMAADEAHDNWRMTADFNEQGRSIGLEEAEQMVRRVLSESGGGDT